MVGLAFVIGYVPLLAARAGEGEELVETALGQRPDRLYGFRAAARSRERPILGVGIGNFPWRTSYYLAETNYDLRGDNVHNVLLSVAAELGIVGLLLLIAAIIFGMIAAVKACSARSGGRRPRRAAGAVRRLRGAAGGRLPRSLPLDADSLSGGVVGLSRGVNSETLMTLLLFLIVRS